MSDSESGYHQAKLIACYFLIKNLMQGLFSETLFYSVMYNREKEEIEKIGIKIYT